MILNTKDEPYVEEFGSDAMCAPETFTHGCGPVGICCCWPFWGWGEKLQYFTGRAQVEGHFQWSSGSSRQLSTARCCLGFALQLRPFHVRSLRPSQRRRPRELLPPPEQHRAFPGDRSRPTSAEPTGAMAMWRTLEMKSLEDFSAKKGISRRLKSGCQIIISLLKFTLP